MLLVPCTLIEVYQLSVSYHLMCLSCDSTSNLPAPVLGDVLQALSINTSLIKKKSKAILLQNTPNGAAIPAGDNAGSNIDQTPGSPPPAPVPTTVTTPAMTPTKSYADCHIPYLNSKLTHFLKDALGGNSKTAIILTLQPEASYFHPNSLTLSNLQKATRILNRPRINRLAVPLHFQFDDKSPLSIIGQLKQQLVEPLLKQAPSRPGSTMNLLSGAVGSNRKSSLLPPNGLNSNANNGANNGNSPAKNKNYTLTLRSLEVVGLSYITIPMLPWLKIEIGSNVTKTPKLLYRRNSAQYFENMSLEVDPLDYDMGIPVSLLPHSPLSPRSLF